MSVNVDNSKEEEIKEELDLTEVYGAGANTVQYWESAKEGTDFQDPVELLDGILSRMTEVQSSIDNIIAIAQSKISRRMGFLRYLQTTWEPWLTQYGREILPKDENGKYKRKSFKLSGGGCFFKKTGGWKITDSEAVKAYAQMFIAVSSMKVVETINDWLKMNLPFASLEWKIDRTVLLKYVAETGVVIPGVEYEEVNEFGQLKVGTTKAWSTRSAVSRLRSAFADETYEDNNDE